MQAASWHRLYRLSGTCFSLRAASPWSPPKSRCAKKLYNIHDPILNCREGAIFLSPDGDAAVCGIGARIFRRAHHGNGVRRGGGGGHKPRDGARAMVWPRMTGPPTLIDLAE